MKKIIITFLGYLIAFNFVLAQDGPELNCTPSHNIAQEHVEYFLSAPHLKDIRIQSGTNNIPLDQIQHVDNTEACNELNIIVNSDATLNKVNATSERTKFYYQTNSFYYIFWDYTDGKLRTGPKRIFVVVNKNTKTLYKFYI